MNVIMKMDPDKALSGAFSPDLDHSGWAQSWGAIKGPPEDREFAGLFCSQKAADAAAVAAGPAFKSTVGKLQRYG